MEWWVAWDLQQRDVAWSLRSAIHGWPWADGFSSPISRFIFLNPKVDSIEVIGDMISIKKST